VGFDIYVEKKCAKSRIWARFAHKIIEHSKKHGRHPELTCYCILDELKKMKINF